MTAYPIEKGIPMPNATGGMRARRYPIREMEIGDSFLVPSTEVFKHIAQAVRNSAAYYGRKVAVRKMKDGVRVWRVK